MDAINLPTTSNNMPHSGTLEMPCGRLCHLLPRRLRVCHGLSENLGLGFPKNLMITMFHTQTAINGYMAINGHTSYTHTVVLLCAEIDQMRTR